MSELRETWLAEADGILVGNGRICAASQKRLLTPPSSYHVSSIVAGQLSLPSFLSLLDLVASELLVGLNSSVMASAAEQPGLRQRKDGRGVSSAQESSNSGLDANNGQRAPEDRSSVSRSLSSLNTSDLLIPLSLVFGGCCS